VVRQILAKLQNRWVLTGIGAAAAGLSIWLFGPFLGVLGHFVPTTIALVLLTFAWGGMNTLVDQRRRHADAALANGIVDAGKGAGDAEASREEVSELRARLTRALTLMRQTHGRGGYLYEQPWYVIIGPPGAGKTTALENSGLTFPLEGELGHGEIKGVGGTALCEWIFTDQAILIDTAGRFVTQDSNLAVDRAGWEGFLDLLRRTRPRQPLNGVIVAIGLNEIVQQEDERHEVARAIRTRLKELTSKLGVRLPVYVVLTKCDLLPGFAEFFGDYDRSQRGQVWGVTFPAAIDQFGPAKQFATAFRDLVAQISARLLDRLHDARTLESRAAVTAFPSQLANIEGPLSEFVEEAFAGTKLAPSVWLRGIYLTSATQTGTSIDRLTAQLAQSFGLDQKALTRGGAQKGKSFFLERLLKDVIFGEAMLSGGGEAGQRHDRMRLAALCGAGALLALGLSWIAYSDWMGVRAVDRFNQAIVEYVSVYRQFAGGAAAPSVPADGSDLMSVLPVLNKARALAAVHEKSGTLGLTPASEINGARQSVYQHALEYLLRPRLLSLLEARLRSHAESMYALQTARIYHMVSGRDPTMGADIHAWLAKDLTETMDGEALRPARSDILDHADALFLRASAGAPPTTIGEDMSVVARAEHAISRTSIPDQIYAELQSSTPPSGVHDFNPAREAGEFGQRYFQRKSGAALDAPVPGFFTPAGFRLMVEARLADATEHAIALSHVRGDKEAVDPNDGARRQQIEREVIAKYTRDYISTWNGLLADIDIRPPQNSAAAMGALLDLTAPAGPIVSLLHAVTDNLAVASTARPGQLSADPTMSGAAIDDAFATLREYVNGSTLKARLERLGQQQPDNPAAAVDLTQAFAQDPEPAGRWLAEIADSGNRVRSDQQQRTAKTAFLQPGGASEQCHQATQLYPFNRFAHGEASIEQFSTLFMPNGTFDAYFAQYVRPFATTGASDTGGAAPPVPAQAVTAFQKAGTIRDAFFGFGGANPRVNFNMRVVSFGPGTTSATLEIGGDSKTFTVQSPSENYEWPGATGDSTASLQFDPPGEGAQIREAGTWALFHLVADGVPVGVAGNERAIRLTYAQGTRQATFQLSAWPNAFRPTLLSNFSCPAL